MEDIDFNELIKLLGGLKEDSWDDDTELFSKPTTKIISMSIDIPIKDKQTQNEIKKILKKVSQIVRHKYPKNIKIKVKHE